MGGGGGKGLSHPEGGRATNFGVVLTRVLQVLTILEGRHKRFPSFERGGMIGFTLS